VFFAGFVKIAAFVLRRTTVSWSHTFIFSLMIFFLTVASHFSGLSLESFFPPAIAFLIGFGINLFIGAWFFSGRATHADGDKVGWLGGLKLVGASYALMLLVSVPVLLLIGVLLPAP
jgi:hypothetical protein